MNGRTRAAVLLALVAGLVVLVGSAPAQAHAYLVGSDPADGASLQQAPTTLRLDFSEHVVLGASRLTLVDGHGRTIAVRGVRVVSDEADSEQPSAITAELPTLSPDVYRLQWETLSADDLHRTAGVIRFGIGRDVAPAATARASTRWSEALLHGLLLLATALAAGPLLAGRALTGAGRRLAPVAAWSACALSVALLVDQVAASGSTIGAVLGGGYGVRWLVRAGGLLLLAVAAGRGRQRLAWAGVVVTGVGTALLGHVGASGAGLLTIAASAAHVTAASVWSGAVLCLATAVVQRRRDLGVAGALQSLRAFGPPAAACLSVVVVTGVVLTSRVVTSVDAALMSTYGRALAAKVVLVACAAAVAVLNHRRVRGPHDLDVPTRGVAVEALVLGVVLALTGLLASTGTATDPAFRAAPAPSSGTVGREVADLQVGLGLSPNQPGRTVALVEVYDTRRPAPAPVTGVDVALGTGRPTPAAPLGDGRWSAPLSAGHPGSVTLHVIVHRSGLRDARTSLRWTVGGGPVRHPVVVSQAPLRGLLLLVAAALAAILGVGRAGVVVHR